MRLNQIQAHLLQVSETPGLDAQVILAHILGKPRSWVLAHPEFSLTPEQAVELERALARLEAGEPLPYVLGHWEFFGMDFSVNRQVLIPRPETELMVEQALTWLRRHPARRAALDVGTGNGCIALSLAIKIPDLHVLASDISPGALEQAQSNLHRYALQGRVQFILADLFPEVGGSFDLICANLPYIPSAELARLKGLEVAFPSPRLCTDNAAMIAAAGAFHLARGVTDDLTLEADPALRLKNSPPLPPQEPPGGPA